MTKNISKLLEPITIGRMELKNKMAMPPMTMCYASETGGVSQQEIDYFVERARGGAALIIVGGVTVESRLGRLFCPSPLLAIDSDEYVAGFSRLVEAVHDHGAKIAIQLYHAGRQTTLERTRGHRPISSSEAETYLMGALEMPKAREMTLEEIETHEDAYAEAARRAMTAGFDAILIDGGGGYGIAQFMSPYVNRRTDHYGGNIESRMLFPLNIITKIREKVGPDYTLLFDLPANEFMEGGIDVKESTIMAQMLERAGIDAFRIHVGIYETYQYVVPPAAVPRGVHAHLAKEIRDSLRSAKMMLGHRINDPFLAEEILQKNMADLILFGRPLIADPEFPKKTMEGRIDDIRKCIACNRGCGGRIVLGLPGQCTVNPMVGKEREYRLRPAGTKRFVLVVGGGVAGMEAARVAALRGHRVTLFEKARRLGGMAIVAAIPPHKYEIKNLIAYYENQLQKDGVAVHLETEMRADDILNMKPGAVIMATGAYSVRMDIPNSGHDHVVNAWDVLRGAEETGERVVIIGGGLVGLETADFLTEKGKTITVLEMLPEAGKGVELFTNFFLLNRLGDAGVAIRTNTKVDEMTKDGVLSDKEYLTGGWLTEADTVVLATGIRPENALYKELTGKIEPLVAIGDCLSPRNLLHAIHEGARAGRTV